MRDMVTAMGIGEEAFAALGRPLDRTSADVLRGPDAGHFLGIDEDLRAEAAANVRRDDAQLVLRRQAMEGRNHETRDMRILAGRIERVVLAARIVGADRGARLHGIGDQAVVDEVDLGDMGRVAEGGVGCRFVADRPVEHPVVGSHLMDLGLGFHGIGHVHNMRQHAVADLHRSRRGLGLLLGLGHHHGDMVADIANLALGEDRMRAGLHGRAVLGVDHPAADQSADLVLGDVLAGEDADHAGHLLRLGGVDRLDRGMGMRAAHEIGVGLLRKIDVVGVLALAGDEAVIFLALDACANSGIVHVIDLPSHAGRASLHGGDDVVIAGAAADIALELVTDGVLVQLLAIAASPCRPRT